MALIVRKEEKKLAVTAATNRDRLAAEQERAGTQMGIDIAKTQQQNRNTKK
jgi:hypothetical protein